MVDVVIGSGTQAVIFDDSGTPVVISEGGASTVLLFSSEAELMEAIRGPQGLPGPPGPAGSGLPFVHVQTEPLSTWLIPHGLGKKPVVTLILDGRQEYTEVSYPSDSLVTVTWPNPTTGEAHLF